VRQSTGDRLAPSRIRAGQGYVCYNIDERVTIQEAIMDLPVKFPSETEVILEDVASFRALSLIERVQTIRGMLATGAHLMSISPKADWARQYSEEQELLAQKNIQEFIARHAR
jgi:hypothetical protein